MVEGTSIGTTVDLDGNFVLNEDLGSDVILVVTSIGYKTARVPVGGGIVNVILEEDSELLDEVVMIGYGVQKKAVVSAAISTVGDDMLEKVAAVRVDDALKGLTPGVNVTSTSGQPGAGSQIRIRGIGTINDANPLYVVDGMAINGGID
jgi:outer membrane receptor for ferrienterochelin and colicin